MIGKNSGPDENCAFILLFLLAAFGAVTGDLVKRR
jgi:hypothetical protein